MQLFFWVNLGHKFSAALSARVFWLLGRYAGKNSGTLFMLFGVYAGIISNSGSNNDHPTSTALKNLFAIAKGCGPVGSSFLRVNGSPFASSNIHCVPIHSKRVGASWYNSILHHLYTVMTVMLESFGLCLPRFWGEPDWTVRQLKEAIEEATSYTVFAGKLGTQSWRAGHHAMIIEKHLKVGHGYTVGLLLLKQHVKLALEWQT